MAPFMPVNKGNSPAGYDFSSLALPPQPAAAVVNIHTAICPDSSLAASTGINMPRLTFRDSVFRDVPARQLPVFFIRCWMFLEAKK